MQKGFSAAMLLLLLSSSCIDRLLAVIVEGMLEIPSGEMASNFEVVLNRGEQSTLSKADGTFTFYEVPPGIYLLDVLSIHHAFPQMKIKVGASSESNASPVSVVEYKYPGAMRNQASYPIRLTAIVPLSYFQVKPPLSIMGMLLGNPMILIFLVITGVMVFFPNTLKEITESEEFKKAQNGKDDWSNAPTRPCGIHIANRHVLFANCYCFTSNSSSIIRSSEDWRSYASYEADDGHGTYERRRYEA